MRSLIVAATLAFWFSPAADATTAYDPMQIARTFAQEVRSDVRWGMSRAEVLSAFPQARADGEANLKIIGDEFYDRHAFAGFTFDEGKLTGVTLVIHGDWDQYPLEYQSVKVVLVRMSGEPSATRENWKRSRFKCPANTASGKNCGWAPAVSSGDLEVGTTWKTQHAQILLLAKDIDLKLTHQIIWVGPSRQTRRSLGDTNGP